MAKNFKKAIACLLAVLMVAFSMPFSALAATGDYEPDVEMLFYPVYGVGDDAIDPYSGPWTATQTGRNAKVSSITLGSFADPNLIYDKTAGTLTFSTAHAAQWMDAMGYEDGDLEDYELGVGDYFIATVVLKGINKYQAIDLPVGYSSNVEPAGVYSQTSGSGNSKKVVTQFMAVSDSTGNEEVGSIIDGMSAISFYESADDVTGNPSSIDTNGIIEAGSAVSAQYTDASSVIDSITDPETGEVSYFVNPKTGALDYAFEDQIIVASFLMKIVDEGPITFSAGDPDGTLCPGVLGGYVIVDTADGIAMSDYTAYGETGGAGAGKLTYFAAEEETPVDTYYTVTYTGDDIETTTEQVIENGSPASIPALPTSDDAHVSYAWDVNPSGAVITQNTTFTVVKTTADHVWSDWTETTAAVDPTCTEAGATAIETRTCSVGGETETRGGEAIEALGHNYVPTVTEPTCTEAGYTTYVCSRCGDTYTEAGDPATGHTAAAAVEENRVEAKCEEAGSYESVVYCSVCGAELSRETVEIPATGHAWGEWTVTTAAVAPTCTEAGATAIETRVCANDASHTETRGGEEIPALGHSYGATVTEPTCTEAGYTTYVCSRCGDTYTEAGDPATGHTAAAAVEENRVEAKCEEAGSYESVVYCSVCGAELSRETVEIPATGHSWGEWTVVEEEIPATEDADGKTAVEQRVCANDPTHVETRGGETIPALGHTHVAGEAVIENEVAATCTTDGSYDTVVYCTKGDGYEFSRETTVVPALGHDWGEWTETEAAVEPTKKTDGKTAVETRTCSRCRETETRGGEVIPALGITITSLETDKALGSVQFDGEDLDEYTKNYAYGKNYTLTAVPGSNAEFVGWVINGRRVSDQLTFKNVAYSDLEVTALFAEKAEDYTITFLNKYGDVLGVWKGETGEIPTASDLPGYKFDHWTVDGAEVSEDEIKALTTSTQVWAAYEKQETGYTVTAEGATITIKGTEYEGVAEGIAYDTKAKVYAEGAKAWSVDGAIIAYGDTYEFYVGQDITLEPVFDEVEQKASVTILGAEYVEGSTKSYNVLATRNLPEGITYKDLKDRGFVYGVSSRFVNINVTTKEAMAEVGNDGIKALDSNIIVKNGTPTASDQFAITMPVSNGKSITVFAFITIQKDGKTEVVYSDPLTFVGDKG